MNKLSSLAALALILLAPAARAQTEAPVTADYGEATLLRWVQPDYPAVAQKDQLEAKVKVEFAVEIDGHVSKATVKQSTNELFDEAALKAVRLWTFTPAIEEGKPAASGMVVTVPFNLKQLKQKEVPAYPPGGLAFLPVTMDLTPARVKSVPDPEYPAELLDKKLPGQVQIEFVVGPDGKAQNPKVAWASHAAFVESALRSIEKADIEPAHQGPVPKPAKMGYPAEFESVDAKPADILAANHLTIVTTPEPEVLPIPAVLIDPVYPHARLLAGENGLAEVEFSLREDGRATNVMLISATAPEFGLALSAAVETWLFKPARSEGANRALVMRVSHKFVASEAESVVRLVAALRPGGAGVSGAAGLDRKLNPLWRGFPVYPQALRDEKSAGTATIEFVVDRDGRARLPRIVSASRDEFGWAAATAISQWVFERPVRKGEPADVKVAIPVSFPPPSDK